MAPASKRVVTDAALVMGPRGHFRHPRAAGRARDPPPAVKAHKVREGGIPFSVLRVTCVAERTCVSCVMWGWAEGHGMRSGVVTWRFLSG